MHLKKSKHSVIRDVIPQGSASPSLRIINTWAKALASINHPEEAEETLSTDY